MDNWNIEEIEEYFKGFPFPNTPIVVNAYSTILNCRMFYETNIAIAKRNIGKPWFKAYLERCISLKVYFETERKSYPPIILNPMINHVEPILSISLTL